MGWTEKALLVWLGLSAGFAGVIGLGCLVAILIDWFRRLGDQAADQRANADRRDHIAVCQEFERLGGASVDWDAEFSDFLRSAS